LASNHLYTSTQRVVLQICKSTISVYEWETSRHGICVGPILVNLYINFPSILKEDIAHAILYADYTTVIVTSNDLNTLNDKLNTVMKHKSSWFHNNHLVLNLGKMHLVKFSTPKLHSENLVKKFNTACFMLRKLQFVVSEQVLRMVYFSHYQS
jgi:hypothetical protein